MDTMLAPRLEKLREAASAAYPQPDLALLARLTDTEFACIVGVVSGLKQKQVTENPNTGHARFTRLYRKLGVRNYAGLLAFTYAVLDKEMA